MDKPIYTECAMCNHKIKMGHNPPTVLDNIPGVRLEKEMMACGIERTFYICPHCGYKYTVMLTDEKIRMLIQKRDRLKGFANISNAKARQCKQKEYEKLDPQIKEKLNKLNGK